MEQSKTITAVLAVLIAGTAARADLMPVREPEAGCRRGSLILPHLDSPSWDASGHLARLVVADLDSRARGLVPEEPAPIEPASETAQVHVLADRQNSVSLCWCALLGLGLYKAAPCVKRLSWGPIPEWYQDGGPYQIGPSLAVAPDGLGPVLAGRLVPPDARLEEPAPPYRSGILPLLWRKSQLSASLLASRGPPLLR